MAMKLYPFYFCLHLDSIDYPMDGVFSGDLKKCEPLPDTLPFLLVIAAEFPSSIFPEKQCDQTENLGLVHLSLQETNCEPLLHSILKRCRRFGSKTVQLQPLSTLKDTQTEYRETRELKTKYPNVAESKPSTELVKLLARKTAAQISEYICGQREVFELPLLLLGTEFQLRAWKQLAKIPYAQTVYYEQQAIACGNARASRAIGMANHDNPLLLLLPCHRVLSKNGKLTGFRPGLAYKQYFLALERHNKKQL